MKSKLLVEMMGEYFHDESDDIVSRLLGSATPASGPELPVSAKKDGVWNILKSPRRFSRTHDFPTPEAMRFFLQEILDYQEELGHHANIGIPSPTSVVIEVYTHDVNDITEIDREYITVCDKIYGDALQISPYTQWEV